MTFDTLVYHDPIYVKFDIQHASQSTWLQGVQCHFFGYGYSGMTEEMKVGKPFTSQCRKMQAVTALCRFDCGVMKVLLL